MFVQLPHPQHPLNKFSTRNVSLSGVQRNDSKPDERASGHCRLPEFDIYLAFVIITFRVNLPQKPHPNEAVWGLGLCWGFGWIVEFRSISGRHHASWGVDDIIIVKQLNILCLQFSTKFTILILFPYLQLGYYYTFVELQLHISLHFIWFLVMS